MASSAVRRSRELSRLAAVFSLRRAMGGGPRTFPDGLNKWQFKRMHEKRARDKERRLLQEEKQVYEARLRSEIRAMVAGRQTSDSSSGGGDGDDAPVSGYMSSKDQIKALADRFMKSGAEDLWNDDDGPLRSEPRPPQPDLQRFVGVGRRGPPACSPPVLNLNQRREYSAVAWKDANKRKARRWWNSSSEDEDSDSGADATLNSLSSFVRFSSRDSEAEDSDNGDGRSGGRRKTRSGAALLNHDLKKEKRPRRGNRPVDDLPEQIQEFRDELRKRELCGTEVKPHEAEQESHLSNKRFVECNLSSLTIDALTSCGYTQMTIVQDAAIPVCLEGKDALVKAKTGTGKSVAFLLPAIETVIKAMDSCANIRVPPLVVLVLCPTRELAIQIAAEAKALLKYHARIGVQTLIGGTRFKLDQKRLELDPCQIIVATPGRLLDHIENKTGFSVRLMGLKLLILDEADHMLDLGFRKDIEKIVDSVPRQRQTLLFSATVPKEVRRISQLALKKDHVFVDTVGIGRWETPDKVLQSYVVAPHDLHFHIVYHLLKEHLREEPEYKVIVFCTTAMVTAFMNTLLRDLKLNVMEMHSRKPQFCRTRISDEFRESKSVVLVTSDVSSRGVHYPDVTLVIQVGIPNDRQQYIHRLGRTGREGKDGKGILLLAPWEEHFMDEIRDLPVTRLEVPELDPDSKQKVEASIGKIDTSTKEAAYHAWLGFYNSIAEIGREKTSLVELANRFSRSLGLERPPALFRKTALTMGLKDIPGIRIRK